MEDKLDGTCIHIFIYIISVVWKTKRNESFGGREAGGTVD